MFGEDFLIKLGFDIDNDKIKKLRKELDKLQSVVMKRTDKTKTQTLNKELATTKQLTQLERKRLIMRKKMDKLRDSGYKGSLGRYAGSMKSNKSEILDARNTELDELLRVSTNEAKKKASIEKKSNEESKAAKLSQKQSVEVISRELKEAASKLKLSNNATLSLERKRINLRKKMDRLRELDYKGNLGRFSGSLSTNKKEVLDTRNVELDEILRVATNEAKKKASIERKATAEARLATISQNKAASEDIKKSAKLFKRNAEIAASKIKQAVSNITRKDMGRGKASNTLFADMLREEEVSAKKIEKSFSDAAKDAKRIKREKLAELVISRRQSRIMSRAVNDFAHAFAAFGILYAGFASIRDAQQVKFNMENAETQMQIAFGDKAEKMMDNFVGSVQKLNLGIGKVASMETLSQVAPALRGRFNEEDTQGIAKELLIVSKFSGQLQDMAAIARNFGQMTTSLEGEDVNQFADRMKGLMPFIYENLKEAGKISEANRASFMKAKDAGTVVSDDFVKAFRKSVQRITKDEKLLAKLGGKLNVAWGALIASIEDARLSFIGGFKDDGSTSLAEQLKETYETLQAFFSRSTRTWKAWGEVLGSVIKGMTWAFLELEQIYLRFAIMLQNMFGLDDDAARRAAIWTALGVVMLPVIGFFAMLGLKLKKLLGIFKLFGLGAGGGKALVTSLTSLARSIPALTAIIGLLYAAINMKDWLTGEDGLTPAERYEEKNPEQVEILKKMNPSLSQAWKSLFGESDSQIAEAKAEERAKQVSINSQSKLPWATAEQKAMYRDVGLSPREKAARYNTSSKVSSTQGQSIVDNKNITVNNTINESVTPQSTAKELSSSMTKGFEKDGMMTTLMNNM